MSVSCSLVPYIMIPVDSFYHKLNSVRAVVVKRKAILIVVFLQINSSYLHLLQMDFSLLACQHFGGVGCLKIWPVKWYNARKTPLAAPVPGYEAVA